MNPKPYEPYLDVRMKHQEPGRPVPFRRPGKCFEEDFLVDLGGFRGSRGFGSFGGVFGELLGSFWGSFGGLFGGVFGESLGKFCFATFSVCVVKAGRGFKGVDSRASES